LRVLDVLNDRSETCRARTRIFSHPVVFSHPVAEALTTRQVMAGQDVPVAVWDVLTTPKNLRQRRGRRHELATVGGGGRRGGGGRLPERGGDRRMGRGPAH